MTKERHQYYAVTEHYFDTVIVPRERDRAAGVEFNWPAPADPDEIYTRVGDEAHIALEGELDPDYYAAIITAVGRADRDPAVRSIVLMVNSPGGTVEGVAQAALAIRNAAKPTVARVSYLAASGAYWLATQARKIEAEVGTVMVGSIGVIVATWDFTKALEEFGVKRIIITNSASPKKYNDPATEEGRAEIVKGLDDIFAEFVAAVAAGRKVKAATVENDYGKGAVLIAAKALEAGMIDGITGTITTEKRGESMTKEDQTYTQAELTARVEAAVTALRTDVAKHLAYVGRVQDDKAIAANIVAGKSYADCVEGYAESAGLKKENDARIAAAPAETAAPKGNEPDPKVAAEKAKTDGTLKALTELGYKVETTDNRK